MCTVEGVILPIHCKQYNPQQMPRIVVSNEWIVYYSIAPPGFPSEPPILVDKLLMIAYTSICSHIGD